MKDQFIYLLTFAYWIWWIVTFIGFIPTMVDLWNKKPSANIMTYVVWTTTTLITSLYWIFILQNLVFNIVINLQLLACFVILILRLRLKYLG